MKTIDIPKGFRKPTKIEPYTRDIYWSNEAFGRFHTLVSFLGASYAIVCRTFPLTTRKATICWFQSLPPNSIINWKNCQLNLFIIFVLPVTILSSWCPDLLGFCTFIYLTNPYIFPCLCLRLGMNTFHTLPDLWNIFHRPISPKFSRKCVKKYIINYPFWYLSLCLWLTDPRRRIFVLVSCCWRPLSTFLSFSQSLTCSFSPIILDFWLILFSVFVLDLNSPFFRKSLFSESWAIKSFCLWYHLLDLKTHTKIIKR